MLRSDEELILIPKMNAAPEIDHELIDFVDLDVPQDQRDATAFYLVAELLETGAVEFGVMFYHDKGANYQSMFPECIDLNRLLENVYFHALNCVDESRRTEAIAASILDRLTRIVFSYHQPSLGESPRDESSLRVHIELAGFGEQEMEVPWEHVATFFEITQTLD